MSKRHSLYAVNILFLIVLLLQLLNFFVADMPQYPRMILNEALFVLLPSLLYLRWAGLPFKETVRLGNAGWQVNLASFLMGAGLYPISIVLAGIVQMILGYSLGGSDALLPKTPVEGILAVIAYAVMAPLCEEIFARGIIQRTYQEHFSPGKAILFAGGLFIMFHLSLFQGLTIIPLSLALGWVYWRSKSLAASILAHFGANAMAALIVSSNVFWQGAASALLSPVAILAGLVLAALGFSSLRRKTSPRDEIKEVRPRGIKQAWPLLLAGLVYLAVIGLEVAVGRSPELFLDPVTVTTSQLKGPAQWEYVIYNRAEQPIAEATVRLETGDDTILLTWESEHQAYDVEVKGGRFMGSSVKVEKEVSLRRTDGQLIQGKHLAEFEWGKTKTEWAIVGESLSVQYAHAGDTEQYIHDSSLALEEASDQLILEDSSWPWILAALPFSPDYAGKAYYVQPYTWRQDTNDNGPILEPVQVTAAGPETLETPTGSLQAWKVTVGKETAWYSVDAPYVLLQHDNGFETKKLKTLAAPGR